MLSAGVTLPSDTRATDRDQSLKQRRGDEYAGSETAPYTRGTVSDEHQQQPHSDPTGTDTGDEFSVAAARETGAHR